MRKILIMVFFVTSCATPPKKKQPDMVIEQDGHFILGCVLGAASTVTHIAPGQKLYKDQVEAMCMDLYLMSLESNLIDNAASK